MQLLPQVHVVWVPEGRIFPRLADALLELQGDLPAAVGLHSGPSKSADIGTDGGDRSPRAGALYRGAQLNAASSTRLQGTRRPSLRA